MAKSFVPIFELQQIGDEWQFRVHLADGVLEYVEGFKSRSEAENWRHSDKRQVWLKQHGYTE
jgi:hypothetical protein